MKRGPPSGLALAKVAGKWGFVDAKGVEIVPARYGSASDFSEGLAAVEAEGFNGFIDARGTRVISLPAMRHAYYGFHEGLAVVEDRATGKAGFVDRTGTVVVRPRFEQARSFSEGRAAVSVVREDETGWPVREWGFIDATGAMVVAATYEFAGDFSDGLARVERGKKMGFVDRAGREVMPCEFGAAEDFKDGLARVKVGGYTEGTYWYGYVHKTGRFAWRPADFEERDAARAAEENREPTIRAWTDPKLAGKAC